MSAMEPRRKRSRLRAILIDGSWGTDRVARTLERALVPGKVDSIHAAAARSSDALALRRSVECAEGADVVGERSKALANHV